MSDDLRIAAGARAINELPAHVLGHAAEGKPHAEEAIARAVIAALDAFAHGDAERRGPYACAEHGWRGLSLPCPACRALAEAERRSRATCVYCRGRGTVVADGDKLGELGEPMGWKSCPACHGTGRELKR